MIVTKDFVVLNYPKTGSTYLRTCIKSIYKQNTRFNKVFHPRRIYKDLQFPKIYGNTKDSYIDQHGVISQIPKAHQKKPIVTIVRNPLDRVISSYHYEWWKSHPLYDLKKIEEKYPDYPELDLLTFAKFLNDAELAPENMLKDYASEFGYNTRLFLIFYAHDPEDAAKKLASGKFKLQEVIANNITFLKQEHLTDELVDFISVNTPFDGTSMRSVTRQNTGSYNTYSEKPQELLDYVYKMDRHLFEMFYPDVIEKV